MCLTHLPFCSSSFLWMNWGLWKSQHCYYLHTVCMSPWVWGPRGFPPLLVVLPQHQKLSLHFRVNCHIHGGWKWPWKKNSHTSRRCRLAPWRSNWYLLAVVLVLVSRFLKRCLSFISSPHHQKKPLPQCFWEVPTSLQISSDRGKILPFEVYPRPVCTSIGWTGSMRDWVHEGMQSDSPAFSQK